MTANQIAFYPRTGSLQLIQTQTVSVSESSITFAVPPGYSNIRLVINGTVDQTNSLGIGFNANGDVGANYNEQTLLVAETSTIAANHGGSDAGTLGILTGTGSGANASGVIDATVYNYSGVNYKNWIANCQANNSGVANTQISSGYWSSVAPITSISITPFSTGTFAAGTVVSLYGLMG